MERGWFDENDRLIQEPKNTRRPIHELNMIERAATVAEMEIMLAYFKYSPDVDDLNTRSFTADKLKALLIHLRGIAPGDMTKRRIIQKYSKQSCMKELRDEVRFITTSQSHAFMALTCRSESLRRSWTR